MPPYKTKQHTLRLATPICKPHVTSILPKLLPAGYRPTTVEMLHSVEASATEDGHLLPKTHIGSKADRVTWQSKPDLSVQVSQFSNYRRVATVAAEAKRNG